MNMLIPFGVLRKIYKNSFWMRKKPFFGRGVVSVSWDAMYGMVGIRYRPGEHLRVAEEDSYGGEDGVGRPQAALHQHELEHAAQLGEVELGHQHVGGVGGGAGQGEQGQARQVAARHPGVPGAGPEEQVGEEQRKGPEEQGEEEHRYDGGDAEWGGGPLPDGALLLPHQLLAGGQPIHSTQTTPLGLGFFFSIWAIF